MPEEKIKSKNNIQDTIATLENTIKQLQEVVSYLKEENVEEYDELPEDIKIAALSTAFKDLSYIKSKFSWSVISFESKWFFKLSIQSLSL